MDKKSHILICRLCDFYIGFDIDQVNQIVQKKQAHRFAHGSIIEFRGYTFPFCNLPELFHCIDDKCDLALLLNSEFGAFFVPIRSIEGILDIEISTGVDTAERISDLVTFDYAKRIVLWNDLAVPVIDTKKFMGKIGSEVLGGE